MPYFPCITPHPANTHTFHDPWLQGYPYRLGMLPQDGCAISISPGWSERVTESLIMVAFSMWEVVT